MATVADPIERWEPWPWQESPAVVGLSGLESTVLVDPEDPTLDGMPVSRPIQGFGSRSREHPEHNPGA